MKQTILIGLLCLMLAGCMPIPPKHFVTPIPADDPPESSITELFVLYGTTIYRFVDQELGVVCWVAVESEGAGISCVPLRQLNPTN